MTAATENFSDAIAQHDAVVGDAIWVGSEPTFTLRLSETSEWLCEPLGGEKYRYALRMVEELQRRHPGSMVLRTVGRQYAAEDVPRWSIGLLARRDGTPLWQGPADPLADAGDVAACGGAELPLDRLWHALRKAGERHGWQVAGFRCEQVLSHRLLLSREAHGIERAGFDALTRRPSIHSGKTSPDGLTDPLAEQGLLLFSIGVHEADGRPCGLCIELPMLATVEVFFDVVAMLQRACADAGVDALVVQGFAPPVDHRLAWMTVTPDPAVIEVNQAPQPDVAAFYAASRELFDVADGLGLAPYRLQYNGNVSDSGGGGQYTLGGESAAASPFFVEPALLPRLVRYLNHHPALSYHFAHDYLGGAGQSPRPDETTRDAFRELSVAMAQLRSQRAPTPEFLWASLAPFLADPSGNSHRSELNIEKLWNPYLPGRGRLGLVEFRAFRMARSAERSAAIAALLRAVTAMLMRDDVTPAMRDWGDELHDRFALPYFLRRDLEQVFADLEQRGVGLHPLMQALLVRDPVAPVWSCEFAGCELSLEPAMEFWPLVGDVASQESGGSRTVDSSTSRLQLSLCQCDPAAPALDGWSLQVAGFEAPLQSAGEGDPRTRLIGIRYRDFTPWRGLHPAIAPLGPVRIVLTHPDAEQAVRLTLFNWQPHGQPYDGLPASLDVAVARRHERLVVETLDATDLAAARQPPPAAVSAFTLDLRLCQAASTGASSTP
ncbi:MAG: transglutaminase family protein [Chromatiaceae bacterium]|nr:transglutaminase family protein [Chromatiaceae bacterium]MCP5423352.1 transglutaminase family protein [Chromatiaceae bacterium]